MTFKLKPLALALSVVGLSACGGGSGDTKANTENETTVDPISYSVSISVDNAVTGTLCADSNENLVCDSVEVQTSITDGTATLTSEDVAILNQSYIVTEGNVMILSAPAAVANDASIVMTPATTLVSANMIQGISRERAIEAVVSTLNDGLSLSLSADTLLTAQSADLANFNTEFVKLWQAAQQQSENKGAILTGFAIQLADIITAIKNNSHFNQLDSFVANALNWSVGFPMTDTGVTAFANLDGFYNTASVADFPGQDADYGLDLTKNNDADGAAGFSYVKLSSTGEMLAADAEQWSCVKDLQTGLIWEVKDANAGIRHKDTLFAFKPSDRESIFPAEVAEASCDNAEGVCTVSQYESYINNLNNGVGLCGHSGWKLPKFNELYSLVHFGSTDKNDGEVLLGIDVNYFPETHAGDIWTATPSIEWHTSMYYAPHMWALGFNGGYIGATTSYEYCDSAQECEYPSVLPVRLVTLGAEK